MVKFAGAEVRKPVGAAVRKPVDAAVWQSVGVTVVGKLEAGRV